MSETVIVNPNHKVPELRTVITISVNEANQLVVQAPFTNKKLCMHALADALKTVADHEDPIIKEVPNVS